MNRIIFLIMMCFCLTACDSKPVEIENVEIIPITNELTSTVIYADEHVVIIKEGLFSNDFSFETGDTVELLYYTKSASNFYIVYEANDGKTYEKNEIKDVILK